MIIGHLDALPLAGLPPVLYALLSRPDCTLQALSERDDGRWQPDNAPWFCQIGPAQTQPRAERHTEYHHQWADIQVVLREKNSSMPARALLASRMTKSVKRTCSLPAHRHTASGSVLARVTLRSFLPENHTRRCAPAARR